MFKKGFEKRKVLTKYFAAKKSEKKSEINLKTHSMANSQKKYMPLRGENLKTQKCTFGWNGSCVKPLVWLVFTAFGEDYNSNIFEDFQIQ